MNTNSKIAIIGAMECEINEIKKSLINLKEESHCDLKIFTGNINNYFVILSQSGIGKVNAALNTQYIVDTYNPNIILNLGVAGGIAQNLEIGDVVIAQSLIQHDFDATPLGYARGNICTNIDKERPTYFCSNKNLIENFQRLLSEYIPKNKIHQGIVATGDIFVSDDTLKQQINTNFNALAVEMEGCAIAQVATKNNIPFIVLRAISDLANKAQDYKVNLEDISKIPSKAIINFLKI